MFNAVLITNRGEVAVRVARACRELGIRSVAVHSEADTNALHVRMADESHLLGPGPAAESYLDRKRVVGVAMEAGVDAVHPGYGFLAENADFARAVIEAGLTWIGPPPMAIEQMGDKLNARAVARAAEVPVLPGMVESTQDPDAAIAFGEEHGWPVVVKAAFGGGGRGMKVVRSAAQMRDALAAASREALASFGRGDCYLERYLERPRHIEVQVLGDTDGTIIHLGDRDCSLQRRHQKLLEEAPASFISDRVRNAMRSAAIQVATEMRYVNAGTCEFLLDADGESFFFLEMNTRLQVEHPVTELITGIDLVHKQLEIAAGQGMGLTQKDVSFSGHAIEARLNAEDPGANFAPRPGTIEDLRAPRQPWVRLDAGVGAHDEVSELYDSMIGKLVVWGEDRTKARQRMGQALRELVVVGVPTTVPFHELAIDHEQFVRGDHSTVSVESEWDLSTLQPLHDHTAPPTTVDDTPIRDATRRSITLTIAGRRLTVSVYGYGEAGAEVRVSTYRTRENHRPGGHDVPDRPELRAPINGTIVTAAIENGARVAAGDLVCVIEAMKMETHVTAHREGIIGGITFAVGDFVEHRAVLAIIEDS